MRTKSLRPTCMSLLVTHRSGSSRLAGTSFRSAEDDALYGVSACVTPGLFNTSIGFGVANSALGAVSNTDDGMPSSACGGGGLTGVLPTVLSSMVESLNEGGSVTDDVEAQASARNSAVRLSHQQGHRQDCHSGSGRGPISQGQGSSVVAGSLSVPIPTQQSSGRRGASHSGTLASPRLPQGAPAGGAMSEREGFASNAGASPASPSTVMTTIHDCDSAQRRLFSAGSRQGVSGPQSSEQQELPLPPAGRERGGSSSKSAWGLGSFLGKASLPAGKETGSISKFFGRISGQGSKDASASNTPQDKGAEGNGEGSCSIAVNAIRANDVELIQLMTSRRNLSITMGSSPGTAAPIHAMHQGWSGTPTSAHSGRPASQLPSARSGRSLSSGRCLMPASGTAFMPKVAMAVCMLQEGIASSGPESPDSLILNADLNLGGNAPPLAYAPASHGCGVASRLQASGRSSLPASPLQGCMQTAGGFCGHARQAGVASSPGFLLRQEGESVTEKAVPSTSARLHVLHASTSKLVMDAEPWGAQASVAGVHASQSGATHSEHGGGQSTWQGAVGGAANEDMGGCVQVSAPSAVLSLAASPLSQSYHPAQGHGLGNGHTSHAQQANGIEISDPTADAPRNVRRSRTTEDFSSSARFIDAASPSALLPGAVCVPSRLKLQIPLAASPSGMLGGSSLTASAGVSSGGGEGLAGVMADAGTPAQVCPMVNGLAALLTVSVDP